MQFIETSEQIVHAIEILDTNDVFVFHLFTENQHTHPIESKPMLLMIRNIRTHEKFAISFSHPDCIATSTHWLSKIGNTSCKKLIIDKKNTNHIFSFKNSVDISLHTYFRNKNKIDIELPKCISCKSIPIMRLLKIFNDTSEKIISNIHLYESHTDNLINDLSSVLSRLETSKIFSLKENKLLHTQYNMFTPTSRPSNRYNNINFLALNKKNGGRNDYTSRYGSEGAMAMIDYESYHLRLFANHIQYKLPKDSLHTYLGKLYHNKETLTEEEYELSKKITFNLIFGGITQDIIDNVPFMKAIHEYVMNVKTLYEKHSYVETWIYKRRIYSDVFESSPSPYKVFNYLLQAAETERNCKILGNVLEFIENKQIKLPLYTYDAFLFDLHKSEFKNIKEIINIMNHDGEFPLKLYVGGNYGDLVEINV